MQHDVNNSGADTARGFFAVDRRTWSRACGLGVNGAVSYLVLGRGTAADNRTTAWSVQAIEKYTGLSRGKASASVKVLQDNSFVRLLRGGTKPKYELLPFLEIPGMDPRQPLNVLEDRVVGLVQGGKDVRGSDRAYARRAAQKGWLVEGGSGSFTIAPEPDLEPDWIWLPNELVTGAANEAPPVELVRQTQDVMTLRMLVDFYHAQNLREDGGIGRGFTHQKYDRFEVGRQSQYVVWGFSAQGITSVVWNGSTTCHRREKLTDEEKAAGQNAGIDFFRRQSQLVGLGLIEWVPHLFESDELSAEIIHPVGLAGSASLEDRLGLAAHEAGRAMLTDGQREWAAEKGLWLAPVPRHVANVQMIGIARLRYRPHTRVTAAWWADLNAKGEKYITRYSALAGSRAQPSASSR
jgi:hypothetical protein